MSKENNIFITSHNQMGGITAQTVNIGSIARSMNEDLGAQLKQQIPLSAAVRITAVWGDGEAFRFAKQIFAWMKGNGYTKVDGVDQAAYSEPVTGQTIKNNGHNQYDIVIGTNA